MAPENNEVDLDCTILDGAAIVNMLKPNGLITFEEYATKQFSKFIEQRLAHTSCVDIFWDVYIENSLKLSARAKRGKVIIHTLIFLKYIILAFFNITFNLLRSPITMTAHSYHLQIMKKLIPECFFTQKMPATVGCEKFAFGQLIRM